VLYVRELARIFARKALSLRFVSDTLNAFKGIVNVKLVTQ
jgi:hypothetical protein